MLNSRIAIYAGVFVLGGLLSWGVMNTINPIPRENLNSSSSFGAFGYGRGNGSQKENDMGQNRQGRSNKTGLNNLTKQNCLMDGCLLVEDSEYPVEQLSQQTTDYLEVALADERKAAAFYQAVIDRIGAVRPFINILRAEEQHQAMLKALFDKYGVSIPADTTAKQASPATLAEACQAGVDAEIANDALYQTMLPTIEQEDIKTIFTNLANASKDMHLPAFERCN